MKTYKATRKINLARYGLPYEALDIGIEGCTSKEALVEEMNAWRSEIHLAFTPTAEARLAELNAKAKLTFSEESERGELKKIMIQPPF